MLDKDNMVLSKASQSKVEFIRVSYLKESYIFECGKMYKQLVS